MPTVYSKSLASRESTLKEIMGALNDKEVRVIGIYGMGGVGKTTLIEEVARRAEVDGSFSEVVIVEVSQAPDVSKMQQHIAERIKLPLKDYKSADERARRIHERLRKKTLNEASDQTLKKGGSQAVVILDNIWKKLDLDKVGILRDCKIVLTTRSEDVCHKMGADKIIEVRGLDDTEATKLFLERARHRADLDEAYKSVTSELVKKCEGLPLAIAALADALRGRDLSVWKRAAAQLERPVSARVGGAIEENVYPVLKWSYDFISGDEKKKFFLLCCLFPLGSSIAVQDLMRYGVGWGLFQYKNSLGEAIAQGKSWIAELKSSSLLLEAEDEQHVKMHDVIREALLSIAGKGGNVFQLGSFPQLLMRETFKSYTVISMTHGDNHEPLNRFKFSKLEMLLLKESRPSNEFSNHFFQGMKNLKVLVMSDMELETLPSSIIQLKNLRMLHLEHCRLSDISPIAKLVDLLFLSLRESTIFELPESFKDLVHLKSLDLTGCSNVQKIPASVIAKLIRLEELYMMGSLTNEGWRASSIDLKSLSDLVVLEIHVPHIEFLPDKLSFPHLSRFLISIGNECAKRYFTFSGRHSSTQQPLLYSRILFVNNIDASMPLKKSPSLNYLLEEAECLVLEKITSLINVTDSLVNDRFRNLKILYVIDCNDIKYIASTTELNEEGTFPKLEELYVKGTCQLKGICHGPDFFPQLKKLYLFNIKVDQDEQDHQPFFNKKMKFPSLEELSIQVVGGIRELWHLPDVDEDVPAFPRLVNLLLWELPELKSIWRNNNIITHGSFRNLRSLGVHKCDSLEMLCPLSVATTLEQLDYLFVSGNMNMKEIIAKEIGEINNNDTEMTIFPKLQMMILSGLNNLKCFFEGSIKIVFPSIESISCNKLDKMVAFVSSENPRDSNALFNDKVIVPSIKDITFSRLGEVQEIWGCHLNTMSFSGLETINIRFAKKVKKVFSLDVIKQMQSLKELNLQEFQLVEKFIDHVEPYDNEVENLALLPQLRNLVMESFSRLKWIPWRALALENLRDLNISKIHGLTSLFPASECKRFVKLETLTISDCQKMRNVVGQEPEDTNTVEVKVIFPRLNFLRLSSLPAFQSLGSDNIIFEFPSTKGVDFDEFQNQILLDLLQKFQHVKELQLGGCEALSELFNCEGHASAIPPRLRKLKLYDMPNLQKIPTSCSKGFAQLEEIHIDNCKELRHVLAQENSGDTSNNAASITVMFHRVKIIKLYNLQNLHSFSSENYQALEFPFLEKVEINGCPMMKVFSHGSLSTPRLCAIKVNGKEEQCFNLNAAIGNWWFKLSRGRM